MNRALTSVARVAVTRRTPTFTAIRKASTTGSSSSTGSAGSAGASGAGAGGASSSAGAAAGINAGHLGAGAAGGVVVLLGGYLWYRQSGLKTIADTTKMATKALDAGKQKAGEIKDKVAANAPSASTTISYLQSAATVLIPGSAAFLNPVFDQMSKLAEEKGDELQKILSDTYNDLNSLSKKGVNENTASKALEIIQKRAKEIQDIAGDIASNSDFLKPLMDKYPDLKEKVGDKYEDLKEAIQNAKNNPEAKKLISDLPGELKQIADKGMNKEGIKEAQKLLEKKLEQAKKLAKDAANDAQQGGGGQDKDKDKSGGGSKKGGDKDNNKK